VRVALATPLALLLHIAAAPAQDSSSGPHLPDAGEAQLPETPPPIGPLRRGAHGEVEVITPESERKAGRPLCDKGAKCVGEGEAFPTLASALAAAKPGDTIDVIGGTYHEAAVIAVPRLTLRGTAGRPHFDCAGIALAGDKACLAVAADGVTLDNLEISGATSASAEAAACVRSDGNLRLTLNDVFCHASQSGLVATGGTITIVHSEFYENGGGSDNRTIDLGRDCTSVTVTGSVFRDSLGGDEFASRCLRTEISDSTFRSMRGERALDFPVGGDATVYRSTIEKGAGAHGNEIVSFASEPCEHHGSLQLKEIQITNSHYEALIVNYDKCIGDPITVEDVGVDGMPVSAQGFIVSLGGNNLRGIPPGARARPPAAQTSVPGAGSQPPAESSSVSGGRSRSRSSPSSAPGAGSQSPAGPSSPQ
jgi:hypothetical protein